MYMCMTIEALRQQKLEYASELASYNLILRGPDNLKIDQMYKNLNKKVIIIILWEILQKQERII